MDGNTLRIGQNFEALKLVSEGGGGDFCSLLL